MSPNGLPTSSRSMSELNTVKDLVERGWLHHIQKEYSSSEAIFRQALTMDSHSLEASYGLALSLKAQGRTEDAIQALQQTLSLLEKDMLEDDQAKATMYRRLVKTHIRSLQKNLNEVDV